MNHSHHRISDDSEIPSLCRKTFVSISRAVTIMWVVAVVVIVPTLVKSLTWALETNKDQLLQTSRIDVLEAQADMIKGVSAKLDNIEKLIKRGGAQ